MNNLRSGYRYEDLMAARLVSSRSDLHRKQAEHGFPRPIKLSDRSAWWPSEEIDAWIEARAALRDAAPEPQPSEKSVSVLAATLAGPQPRQTPAAQGRGRSAQSRAETTASV